ncbi:MAG: hypothetical protein U5M51_12510 [Emticicia sp.]|nr:hypothetical protein [Emticicia sp.]
MKISFTKIIILLFVSFSLSAQTIEGDTAKFYEKRFAFAKMYFGLEMYGSGSGTSSVLSGNTTVPVAFDGFQAARIIWGATHFWGHADFFVAFPVVSVNQKPRSPLTYVQFREDIETGFKIYPFASRPNTIRPYIGASWLPVAYRQQFSGDEELGFGWSKNLLPINLGVSYASKRLMLDAGIQYLPKTKFEYPLSRTVSGNLELPKLNASIGLKYLFEASSRPLSSIEKHNNKLARRKKYNAFYVGFGPSGTFGTQTVSEFNTENYPFLNERKRFAGIGDFVLGYYLHKPDMNIGLSYRNIAESVDAYGIEQFSGRKSLALEVYKFLGDYHGFVPFLGATLSDENLTFQNKDRRESNIWQTYSERKAAVGVIFGWDIRPTRSDWWILRTNLRYTPVFMMAESKKVSFDYLEFNFIQFTMFPERVVALLRK